MAKRSGVSRRLILLVIACALIFAAVATVALTGAVGDGSDNGDSEAFSAQALKDPTTPGLVLFHSSFGSDNFGEWLLQSLPGRARVVSGSAFEGSTDARFEVRPGDVEPATGSNRSEVSGPTFHEGEDIFIRTAIRVPDANTFHGPWQIIQQLHENNWDGSPGVALFLTTARRLRLGAGDGSPIFWDGPKLDRERWYDLVYRVELSQDPHHGFVEVWLDGRRQRLANGGYRDYGQTIQTASDYLKVGIYRDPTSHGISVVEDDAVFAIAAGG